MLQINHYTKQYSANGPKAVDDLSLHIRPGEIYGFLGHNGAGKTTTIKACCGILDFTEGEILINGMSIKKQPLACKKIMAYIPDNPDLYEFMSGIRYLNFVGDVYGVPTDVREKHIAEYAADMGITDALGEKVASYSHGMKQKLAIVSALMHEPKLLIMDEPFVGLDPKAAFILKQFMRKYCDNGGAIFFSTHVLDVAEKLCDKIAIIKGGKLLADGDIETVKGDDSLEEVFLELVDDIKVEDEAAQAGEKHA
ncbi:MAG: ABC transporter ATP-binding protein [Clostridia bacterium]|nr:ABC transporter ATP-binding protein [Clostridia bacterium]